MQTNKLKLTIKVISSLFLSLFLVVGLIPNVSAVESTIATSFVSGDFNGDGKVEYAEFTSGTNNTELKVWDSPYNFRQQRVVFFVESIWFDSSRIIGKYAAGDFDGDGIDEIAALYDYGSILKMWIFKQVSPGVFTNYCVSGQTGDFPGSRVTGLVTGGDFDGDGIDELGVLFDYTDKVGMWVFKRSGSGTGTLVHYLVGGQKTGFFEASKIKGRVTSGDYDGDGIDEIGTLYDYTTKVGMWVFKRSGSGIGSLSHYLVGGQYTGSFNATKMTGRVTSGDFDGDGIEEIGALYDYTTKVGMWVFKRVGSGIGSLSHYLVGGQYTGSFDAYRMDGRVTSWDIDGDRICEIIGFYDYGDYSRLWKFKRISSGGFEHGIIGYKNITVAGMFDDPNGNGVWDSGDNKKSIWINQSVLDACRNIGYDKLNNFMGMNNTSVINNMKNSSFFAINTHGSPTGIMCNYLTGTAPNYTYNFSDVTSEQINALPNGYFNTTRCVLITACSTGQGGAGNPNNLINAIRSKGAWTVIGFQGTTWFTGGRGDMGDAQWSRVFTQSLGNYRSVNQAINDANAAIMISDGWMCGMDSIYVAGDRNQVVAH